MIKRSSPVVQRSMVTINTVIIHAKDLQASCTKTVVIPLEQKKQTLSWFVMLLQCNYRNQVLLDKVDQLDCTKIKNIQRKLVVNHNYYKTKQTTWIKIDQLQPTNVTFLTHWRKPVFHERSVRVTDGGEKHKKHVIAKRINVSKKIVGR